VSPSKASQLTLGPLPIKSIYPNHKMKMLDIKASWGKLSPFLPERVNDPGKKQDLQQDNGVHAMRRFPYQWAFFLVCATRGQRLRAQL